MSDIRFFDSHAHLDDEKFNEDREFIISEISKSDTSYFISAGYSLEGSKKAIELSHEYSFVYATCGISPNDIPQTEEELWKTIAEIEDIIKVELEKKEYNKLVAVGEIGLDYYWEKDEKRKRLQQSVFKKQIEIANRYDLPIVIHTRDAIMDTLEILKKNEVKRKGVFHCCPQNRELIREALKLGYYISFAGPITFKNSKNAIEMINFVPNDKILIETDSPYLAPEPLRGTRNTPINVKYIAQKIAEAKNLTLEEVAQFTTANTKEIFKIDTHA